MPHAGDLVLPRAFKDSSHAAPTEEEPMYAVVRAMARRVAAVIAECNYAQRRMTMRRTSPDRYLVPPRGAPDTYEEFLFRTSGPLPHEPPAAGRSLGRAIR
jgi:hypothetical protein